MRVSADFVCEHGFPKPWVTCVDCMSLGVADRPRPPVSPPTRKPGRPGHMPWTANDPVPQLCGDRDLSTPVHEVDPHVLGPGNGWLFGDQGFPKHLRPGGWVYLRHDGMLGARARVRGIGFRVERRLHTGDPDDLGPGPTIELDAETWEFVAIDLGELADHQRQGYRYLITAVDGSVYHLAAGAPIPDDIEVDPPTVT